MRTKVLALAAAAGGQLILAEPAAAGFLGLSLDIKPNAFGLTVANVYACFDRPGQDRMIAVAGTPNAPLSIEVLNGTFFQHPFGSDKAPNPALFEFFPDLRYDTFVTIGVKPAFEAGDGCALIGQFSLQPLAPGGLPGITIALKILVVSNGVQTQLVVHGAYIGCLGEDYCNDGDPCNGEETCKGGACINGVPCKGGCVDGIPAPDCNANGVLDSCDINNGTSPDRNGNGVPDECDLTCPWDCAGDADLQVGVVDLLALLEEWGAAGSACDFDGDGVGVADLQALLEAWGPCP